MNQDRFAEIERVCQAALDQPPDERAAFVEQACKGDERLRSDVEALLAMESRAERLMEAPPAIAGAIDRGAAPALSPGTRLGPYEIEAFADQGGMGEVYRARDTRLGRTVAIKVLPPAFGADPDRRARFGREARAISALNHPHICALHDIGSDNGIDFLVMEHLDGETVAKRLQEGPLPLAEALEYGAQIAGAIAAAHSAGIIHRDLKPANVMLTNRGAKLLDFGLARMSRDGLTRGPFAQTREMKTTVGAVIGTVSYMAPEQLEGKESDSRADLFALGCLLYEMVTGRRAFSGDTPASVIAAVMASRPPPLSEQVRNSPPGLDVLIERCLQKDPDKRAASARDVAEELRSLKSTSARLSEARWRRTSWAVAALALVVSVGAFWALVRERPRDMSPPQSFVLALPGEAQMSPSTSGSVVALAPDGRGVISVGYLRNSGSRLYWHDLRRADAYPLWGTEDARNPFFSPDGRWVGFARHGKLLKLPFESGRVPQGSRAIELASGVGALRGATWGPDGKILFCPGIDVSGLWQVSDRGGDARQVTAPDPSIGEKSHRWPQFLPGARAALFTILDLDARWDRSSIAVLSLDTGRWTRVMTGGSYARYVPSGYLVVAMNAGSRTTGVLRAVPFDVKDAKVTGTATTLVNDLSEGRAMGRADFDVSSDGVLVYATRPRDLPQHSLVAVSRDGRVAELTPDRRAYDVHYVAISPDGRRVAMAIDSEDCRNLWTLDVRDGRWQRLTTGFDVNSPVWSPAGDRIAFASNANGNFNLYVIRADGERQAERLTESVNLQIPYSWSADDQLIAYQEQDGAGWKTWILPLHGARKPWLWDIGDKDVTTPAFSPDGRWLAYQALASGKMEVYVRPFPGVGEKVRVSGKDGGMGPVWSSDGRGVLYLPTPSWPALGDTRIMETRLDIGRSMRVAGTRVAFAFPFSIAPLAPFQSRLIGLMPDGRLVVVQPDEQQPRQVRDLTVVTNWLAHVKDAVAREER